MTALGLGISAVAGQNRVPTGGIKVAIRIAVAGATGWVGSAIARAILASDEFELVGAVSRRSAGKDIGETFGLSPNGVIIRKTVEDVLITQPDVLVDYTHPRVVKHHTLLALKHGINVVVGTSGMNMNDYQEIAHLAEAEHKGVVAAGNFSLTAALAKHFALLATQHLPSWEVVEYAHANKVDAPSGTVQELAEALGEKRAPHIDVALEETLGERAARGAQIAGVPVHSIRLPSYVLGFEVIFGMGQERLILRHESGSSPEPYVLGTLTAVKHVTSITGLVRGLDQLLFVTD